MIKKKLFFFLFFLLITLLSTLITCGGSKKKETANVSAVEQTIIDGQRQYHLRGCAKCHGGSGLGDGYRTAYLSEELKPRNFRDLNSYKQGYDQASIENTIKNGIVDNPKSIMAGYPHLSDDEVRVIATYVLYLQTNQ